MDKRQADVVIIGSGTAGMAAYRAALKHTDKVIVIEAGEFGTTCARVGCMPSKLLIAAADACHDAQNLAPFGLELTGAVKVDGKKVMHRVKSERDRFVGFVKDTIARYPADRIVRGRAYFIDDHTVQVDDRLQITAKSVVIAAGSRPRILERWRVLDELLQVNDDVFYWDDLPESIAVIGTGVIALELGQALSRLGVRTTIFGRTEHIGGISDPVVLKKAHQVFEAELNLRFNTEPEVRREGKEVVLNYSYQGQEYEDRFALLLAASGRVPNVDGLGLAELGIKTDADGLPVINPETQETSIPHIFIAGDASNRLPLLHVAADEGTTAGNNAGAYPKSEKGLVRERLAVVFSDPQIAVVGKSYQDLDLADTVIGTVEFEDQGRSRVMLVNHGTLRVYFAKDSGIFLGAEDFGPAAEHLGHLLSWACQQRLTIDAMLAMPFYHPVIEEGLRTALRDAKAQMD